MQMPATCRRRSALYRVISLLGEGGMGNVYLAEQHEPIERLVALKVIKPGMDSKSVMARFQAEQQALARMDHPGIAHVFEAGTTELGRPYFAMEYVPGSPITTYADEARLTPRERIGLFVEVCSAIQYAHQKGIIHRDIKPTNVIVSTQSGQPVPKVIDFGIAKAVEGDLFEETQTKAGQLIGTPEYMSPEQAAGQDIDTRTDVYALGLLLYELLVGVLPFDRAPIFALPVSTPCCSSFAISSHPAPAHALAPSARRSSLRRTTGAPPRVRSRDFSKATSIGSCSRRSKKVVRAAMNPSVLSQAIYSGTCTTNR